MLAARRVSVERVLTSIVTGLLVGWVVRTATRSRNFGLLGDLTIGLLGAMFGGWLARHFGILIPGGLVAQVGLSFFGASVLFACVRVLQRLRFTPAWQTTSLLASSELDVQLRRLADLQKRLFYATLGKAQPLTNTNQIFAEQLTFGERIADRVATFGGSWTFLGLFAAFMLGWMYLNTESARPMDPYPFILLNLVLSCLAAVQAPVIMMSQNRQAARDRFDAQQDYQVNLRSELQITALHMKLDDARTSDWQQLIALHQEQLEVLKRLEQTIAERR
jgi:uncharacterized membrane protein/uncharacterized membrane protein YeaQ/YmgE (transglycosylase-associated protein family)